jgi:hypothetical protein
MSIFDTPMAEPRVRHLDEIRANLASLNEIIAEMTAVVSTDPEFTGMVRGVLRDHSWKLGFSFQGQEPPAQLGETDGP